MADAGFIGPTQVRDGPAFHQAFFQSSLKRTFLHCHLPVIRKASDVGMSAPGRKHGLHKPVKPVQQLCPKRREVLACKDPLATPACDHYKPCKAGPRTTSAAGTICRANISALPSAYLLHHMVVMLCCVVSCHVVSHRMVQVDDRICYMHIRA